MPRLRSGITKSSSQPIKARALGRLLLKQCGAERLGFSLSLALFHLAVRWVDNEANASVTQEIDHPLLWEGLRVIQGPFFVTLSRIEFPGVAGGSSRIAGKDFPGIG